MQVTDSKSEKYILSELKELAEIQVGYQARKGILENRNGKFLLIRAQDFDNSGFLHHDKLIRFIPEGNPNLYLVKKGDILFQSRGVKNSAYYIDLDLTNTLAAGTFYILRVDYQKINPEFLVWWLKQKPVRLYFNSLASGTYISFITKVVLYELKVPVPPMHIQKKIIKLDKLWNYEKNLYKKIINKKSQLIEKICLKSVMSKEKMNE